MKNVDTKQAICDALRVFSSRRLDENAINLLGAIGYRSEKRPAQFSSVPSDFVDDYNPAGKLKPDKALLGEWRSIHFLFQLTSNEIRAGSQVMLDFGNEKRIDDTIVESYLFFAIELTGDYYTRAQLASITREVNKLFPMPVMVLFHHGDSLTVSIINRRLHRLDESRDVLEKVTLIKDISSTSPHRAHIEILFDLSLPELHNRHGFTNFVELHRAWQTALDSAELNRRFFEEVANWYFWASQNVTFPKDAGEDVTVRNATGVIRLITRLIFIWFIKEKGLVPHDLFNQHKLDRILNHSDPNGSTYYKAILQNLFFATLNQEMNTPSRPDNRRFRSRSNSRDGRDQHYNITNLYRYQSFFRSPSEALELFSRIPFLNGGLFECLDKPAKADASTIFRVDGYSDRPDNELVVPDFLFFSEERDADLNEEYGTKNKRYRVRGIIGILNRYKFTIQENTPIEEEVALDPELLGKVFENLLANYNPETRATARKQTGSYYTPRDIVNYMVDESLIAYLNTRLKDRVPAVADMEELPNLLREVFAYTERGHPFSDEEVAALVDGVYDVKVLDPACGSGAFPMGVLHKLVFILAKLDPQNKLWRKKQVSEANKEPNVAVRQKLLADIEEAFERNELDYGRKLYLIQNCVYGADVQPIAVQIAKLRFFISLIVDQNLDDCRENRGILPLPNLETKFVAANTLIGLDRPTQAVLRNPAIDQKEQDLNTVRQRHFAARTQRTKQRCRADDARLRAQISVLLKDDGFPRETTEKLTRWDPYDQNSSADFFDPEWMFGLSHGFDVIIANPPYLESRSPSFSNEMKTAIQVAVRRRWGADANLITRGADLLVYFFETSLFLIKEQGYVVFIAQNSWLNTEYGRRFQSFLLKHTHVSSIVDSDFKHFDSHGGPNINTVISVFHGRKASENNVLTFAVFHRSFEEVMAKSSEKAISPDCAEFASYEYSDKMLREYKWGMLHDLMNPVFRELIDSMSINGFKTGDGAISDWSVGQGLNLASDYIVTRDYLQGHPSICRASVSFFTADDGAPFNLIETKSFIVDRAKASSADQKVLRSLGVKAFDLASTSKAKPVLIMPRGIGRHFCAINSASAFSASNVDIYCGSKTDRRTLLRLWLFLNSSVAWLLREASGRKNLGGGMLKAEAVDLAYFPIYYEFPDLDAIDSILQSLNRRSALSPLEEITTAEHKEVDKIVFAYLGLDSMKRDCLVDCLKTKVSAREKKSTT